jgi:hypothetical protein
MRTEVRFVDDEGQPYDTSKMAPNSTIVGTVVGVVISRAGNEDVMVQTFRVDGFHTSLKQATPVPVAVMRHRNGTACLIPERCTELHERDWT